MCHTLGSWWKAIARLTWRVPTHLLEGRPAWRMRRLPTRGSAKRHSRLTDPTVGNGINMLTRTCVLLVLSLADALTLPRRAALSLAAAAAVRTGPPARCVAATGAVRSREQVLEDIVLALRTPTLPPVGASEDSRLERLDGLLDELCLLNPTPKPGSTAGFAPLAAGRWRVAFAPHIIKLSSLGAARFDPIYYRLDGSGGIESNVQYTWLGGVQGWLSTRGRYGSRDEEATSYVEWDDAWWDPGAAKPSRDPGDGALAPLVKAIGSAGFVSSFANFPVRYLDRDVCVFVFPLSGTRIMAVREGGALDVWRGA